MKIIVGDLEFYKNGQDKSISYQLGEDGDMYIFTPGETGYSELNRLFDQGDQGQGEHITAEDINEALDEMISGGLLISEPASDEGIAMLNHLFTLAAAERALSGRVMVMENLLRYAVYKLPETEQAIAREIMHLIGVGPIVGRPGDEEGYTDAEATL